MKNRRDFLKFLGIGAGAAASVALAAVAGRGGAPAAPPRTILDIEAPKPYIGPDGLPGGDYIKRKPDIVRPFIPEPELNRIIPEVNVLPAEVKEAMVDNVFKTSPMFVYLTTTGGIIQSDGSKIEDLGIDNSGSGQSLTIDTDDFTTWTTTWNEMRADKEHQGAGW